MKVQRMSAKLIDKRPPVDAFKITESNIKWIEANVTKRGFNTDGSLKVQSGLGDYPAMVGDIIIQNENGRCTPVSQHHFDTMYEVVRVVDM